MRAGIPPPKHDKRHTFGCHSSDDCFRAPRVRAHWTELMKPARNSLRSRVGRYIAYGVIAAALVTGAVTVYLHVSGSGKERPRTASDVWVKVAPSQVMLGMNPSWLQ